MKSQLGIERQLANFYERNPQLDAEANDAVLLNAASEYNVDIDQAAGMPAVKVKLITSASHNYAFEEFFTKFPHYVDNEANRHILTTALNGRAATFDLLCDLAQQHRKSLATTAAFREEARNLDLRGDLIAEISNGRPQYSLRRPGDGRLTAFDSSDLEAYSLDDLRKIVGMVREERRLTRGNLGTVQSVVKESSGLPPRFAALPSMYTAPDGSKHQWSQRLLESLSRTEMKALIRRHGSDALNAALFKTVQQASQWVPLPREVVFDGQIKRTPLTAELLQQIMSDPDWSRKFLKLYGEDQISQRIAESQQ
jgi:hypothetical protein